MKQITVALSSKIPLRSKSMRMRQREGTVKLYCEAVNYLLGPYATDNVIAGTGSEIMRFTLQLNITPIEYAELLWNDVLHCHRCIINMYWKMSPSNDYETPSERARACFEVRTKTNYTRPSATCDMPNQTLERFWLRKKSAYQQKAKKLL